MTLQQKWDKMTFQQGWDEESQLSLLTQFIFNRPEVAKDFVAYAREQAKLENNA